MPVPPGSGKALYGPHGHSSVDMVFRLGGTPLMFINGEWRELEHDRIWVFTPGAEHGEGYVSPQRAYSILWITPNPQVTGFSTSVYDTVRGDRVSVARWIAETPVALQLWNVSQNPRLGMDLTEQAHFQALFMEAVYFMLSNPDSRQLCTASYHDAIVDQVRHHIETNYWQEMTLAKLAEMVRYSPGHLNAIFRERVGTPVLQYALAKKLEAARELLARPDLPVGRIASRLGFRDPLYFSRIFRKRVGLSPTKFRANILATDAQ